MSEIELTESTEKQIQYFIDVLELTEDQASVFRMIVELGFQDGEMQGLRYCAARTLKTIEEVFGNER